MSAVDISASRTSSFCNIRPLTDAGWDWMEKNVQGEEIRGAWAVEDRYAPALLLGAHQAGLTIVLDGRIANAPRS